MRFKPMTYLVSFTLFVATFTALGGWVGWRRIADHLLAQAYLEATPLDVQVQADASGRALRWEARVPLTGVATPGGAARVLAGTRLPAVEIDFPAGVATPGVRDRLPLAAREQVEDLRTDREGRLLFVRVHAASPDPDLESTWIWRYDLRARRLTARRAIQARTLPVPFRP